MISMHRGARFVTWTVATFAVFLLAACGASGGTVGGNEKVGPSPTVQVTTYYDPGTNVYRKESGQVDRGPDGQATTIRQGRWTMWFPAAQNNGKQFEKTYVDGAWDQNTYWREWNDDTSVRLDWQDH